MLIDLTEMASFIDTAFVDKVPCFLATADAGGMPDIGPKGSMMVFDKDHLAYWERTQRVHLKNVQENPKVCVLYFNQDTKQRMRFYGTVAIHSSGPVRAKILPRVIKPELERDVNKTGYGILVRVDKVVTITGEVIQERDQVPIEATTD